MRLLALITFIFTFSAHADIPCQKVVENYYNQHGQPSDYSVNFSFKREMDAGKALVTQWGETLTVADVDSISIEVTGSYHSGWFSDEVIVNPLNCEIQGHYNTYSE